MQKLCAVVVALAVGASLGVAGTSAAESAKITYAMLGDMEAKGSYDFHTVAGIRDTTEAPA